MTKAQAAVKGLIEAHGPIPAVRVSSAQARGRAKDYPYWGAVRYRVRLTNKGRPTLAACERARSDRRSRALAQGDALQIALSEERVIVYDPPGPLSDTEARRVLNFVLSDCKEVL